jgi:ferric-dicitrate binding protein FerR (iron transport regulator)
MVRCRGWAKRWILKRRTRKDLAAIVQRRFQRLGDRLARHRRTYRPRKNICTAFRPSFIGPPFARSPRNPRNSISRQRSRSADFSQRGSRLALIGAGIAAVMTFVFFPEASFEHGNDAGWLAPWANFTALTRWFEIAGCA